MIAHRGQVALRRASLLLIGALVITGAPGLAGAADEFQHLSNSDEGSHSNEVSDSERAKQLVDRGEEHAQAGRNAQALQAYQRAWRWDPTLDDTLHSVPALATKLDQLDTAARYAQLIVRGKGTSAVRSDPALYRRLATYAAEQGEHDLAAELWESLYDQAAAKKGNPHLQQKLALEVGRQWFISGNTTEASDWFQRVVENPLDEVLPEGARRLWEGFASCHLDAERFDRAEQVIDRLAEESESTGRAAFWQARLALKRNQPAVALEAINECLAAEDIGPSGLAYQLLADALRATNQLDQATQELQRLHDRYPNDPAAWLAWIDQLITVEKRTEALEQTEQLMETCLAALGTDSSPEWDNGDLADVADQQIELLGSMKKADRLWPLLIKLTEWWGSLEPVRESLEQALSDKSLAKSTRVWLASLHPDKMSLDELAVAGQVAFALGSADEAKPFYQPLIERCVASDSDQPEDASTAIDWLNSWLRGLMEIDAWPQVIEAITWARENGVPQSQSADMSYWLAYGYQDSDQNDKALATIRTARQLEPEDLFFAELEASLLAGLDRLDEAIALATTVTQQAVAKNGEPDQTVRSMQMVLSAWIDERAAPEDEEKADELLETILDTWPRYPWANNDLAYRWADQGVHLDRSLRMANVAVEANPESASYADTKGWVLYRLGRHQKATEELRRAVGLLSQENETVSFAVLYEHLAAALEATGDTSGVVEAKAQAQRLHQLQE